jgi:cob(I)alamin adenosyltransferase
MGERKRPIPARRGDGTTTLSGTGRMPESDARIALLGGVDEAPSFPGLARAEAGKEVAMLLLAVRLLLYRVMGDVAMPEEEKTRWVKRIRLQGTRFEWCSASVSTISSPSPRFFRPQAWATRFIDSVVPRVKTRPRESGAPRKRATFSLAPS